MTPGSGRTRARAWSWVYATLFAPETLDDDAGGESDDPSNDNDIVSEDSAEPR